MEKNCVASFYIKLSSNATALPLQESELINLVRTYRYFNRERALDVLFRLKYGTLENKKECLRWFTQKNIQEEKVIYVNNFASNFINFTDEQFCLLADELQTQYMAQDPIFLDIHSIKGLPSGCKKELTLLQEKMADSPLLFFMAVKKCVNAKKNPAVPQWVVQLLSNSSASHTLALESLGFNFNYRLRLKAFSNEIGMLLLAMHQIYVKRQKLFTSQDALVLPLVSLLKRMIELDKQVNMPIEKDTSKEKYNHSHEVSLFENAALNFIELIANVTSDNPQLCVFVEYSQKLEELGKAIISLLQGKEEYKKVFCEGKNDDILFVAATDITLSNKMCTVQQEYKNARTRYFSVLRDFQQFELRHFDIK